MKINEIHCKYCYTLSRNKHSMLVQFIMDLKDLLPLSTWVIFQDFMVLFTSLVELCLGWLWRYVFLPTFFSIFYKYSQVRAYIELNSISVTHVIRGEFHSTNIYLHCFVVCYPQPREVASRDSPSQNDCVNVALNSTNKHRRKDSLLLNK